MRQASANVGTKLCKSGMRNVIMHQPFAYKDLFPYLIFYKVHFIGNRIQLVFSSVMCMTVLGYNLRRFRTRKLMMAL